LGTQVAQIKRFRPLFTWSEQAAMLNIIMSPEEICSVTAYIRNLNKIALEDYVLSPKGCLSTDGNGDPNPHETLGVPPCRPKEYFYSFTNDAWQTYDNIRGSVRLTTRQN
jgi:hypothetical protein